MAVDEAEATDTRPAVEFPDRGDVAFGALMDALSAEGETTPPAGADGAAGAPAVRADSGNADQPAGGADRAPAVDGGDAAPVAGAEAAGRPAGEPDKLAESGAATDAQQPGGSAEGGAEQPAATGGDAAAPSRWTLDAATVAPQISELSAKLEENVLKAHQQAAFNSVKEEHGKYFEALEQHPRLLVGMQVPAIGKEGNETLRSSEDAREWQEAVKSILVQEINARANTGMEESRTFLETVHASIDLFKNNKDLIPGTKDFDKELADQFAAMATPYEVRVDGKLRGYSIPVQPLIDKLRADKKVSKTVKTSQPSTQQQPPAEPPQASIPSKAASSAEKEDFSVLFGTIGLPHLKI